MRCGTDPGFPTPGVRITVVYTNSLKLKLLLTCLLLDQGPTARPGIYYWTRTQFLDEESTTRQRIYYDTGDLLLDHESTTRQGLNYWTRNLLLEDLLMHKGSTTRQGTWYWTWYLLLGQRPSTRSGLALPSISHACLARKKV